MQTADPETEPVQSRVFGMGRGKFAQHLVYRYGRPWLWALAVLVCAAGIGAFYDLRYLVVMLMAVFLVAPMALAFLYFYYGLLPVNAMNTVEHTVEVSPRGISLTVMNCDGEEMAPQYVKMIPASDIVRIEQGLKSVSVVTSRQSAGFVWMPLDAFEGDGLARSVSVMARIIAGNRANKLKGEDESIERQ